MSTDNNSQIEHTLQQKEAELAKHLRSHPDFFSRFPQLLAELIIPHPTSGKTISLLERQLLVLREQQETTNKKLNGLVNNARSNEKLQESVEQCTLFLLQQTSLSSLLTNLPQKLKDLFQLEHIDLKQGNEAIELLQQFDRTQAHCNSSPNPELLSKLFAGSGAGIASVAIIPIELDAESQHNLVLTFGSENEKRYQETTGTKFLTQLQKLLTTTFTRLSRDEQTSSSDA
ncbi:MAG: hypothetical protein ACI8P9_001467 [Parasphingorhabdus sp.]|jgi:uncharacterized protein YigA (DUF484 family)